MDDVAGNIYIYYDYMLYIYITCYINYRLYKLYVIYYYPYYPLNRIYGNPPALEINELTFLVPLPGPSRR